MNPQQRIDNSEATTSQQQQTQSNDLTTTNPQQRIDNNESTMSQQQQTQKILGTTF